MNTSHKTRVLVYSSTRLLVYSSTRLLIKPLYYSLLLALPLFAATACGSDDPETPATAETPQTPTTGGLTESAQAAAPRWTVQWQGTDERPAWQTPDMTAYECSMMGLVTLCPALMPTASEDDMIAAFVGNECRGVCNLYLYKEDGAEKQECFGFLFLRGNTGDAAVSLKYYSARLKRVFTVNNCFEMIADGDFGFNEDLVPAFDEGGPYACAETIGVRLPDGVPFTPGDGDELAVMCGSECRGTVASLADGLYRLKVYAHTDDEPLTLAYYSAAQGKVYRTTQPLTLKAARGTTLYLR